MAPIDTHDTVVRRSLLRRLMGAVATAVLPCSAFAQNPTIPLRQITIVVPFPAGGVTDQLARTVGGKLAENLNVPVVVDNRPGGGAQIAANAVKQAPADGATLFIGDIGAFALNQALYAQLSYDVQKDFVPLARLVLAPSLLVVPAASPFNTMADFVNAARKRPVTIASQSTGSGGHLFAEMLRSQGALQLTHVPYRGSAPALNDLIGAQVEIFFDPVITSGPFVKDGKLKALAYGADRRSAQFPHVPTLSETGWGGANLIAWFGMAVRSGTPGPIVERLGAEVVKAIQSPDVARRLTDQGLDVAPLGPAEFQPFVHAEIARWGTLIKTANIKLE